MRRLGAIFRFLAIVLCLVPVTNTQQAPGVLAPFVPVVPAPAGNAPANPASEEDDERETEDGKERVASPNRHRLAVRELTGQLPPVHASNLPHVARVRTSPPVAADPFRNGLGTPYRC